jgi:oligopeptide transport system permease protein
MSNRDYTMTVGLILLYAAILIALNLLVDFIQAWIDPRVKYE